MHKVVEENFFSFITFRIDQFNCLCFFLWSSGFKNADETLYSRTKRIDHIFGRPFYNASIKTIALILRSCQLLKLEGLMGYITKSIIKYRWFHLRLTTIWTVLQLMSLSLSTWLPFEIHFWYTPSLSLSLLIVLVCSIWKSCHKHA